MYVSEVIGALNTLLSLVFSGIMGVFTMRYAGFRAVTVAQQHLQRGEVPGQAMLDGVLLFLAGILFLLPGFGSDMLALFLLFPPTRIFFRWGVVALFVRMVEKGRTSRKPPHPDTVEGSFYREPDAPPQSADGTSLMRPADKSEKTGV